MDCKIVMSPHRSLWCPVHQDDHMSGICAVAEQELRDTIAQLLKTVAILRGEVQSLEASNPSLDDMIRDLK